MGEVKDSIESYRISGIQESGVRIQKKKGIIILNPELSIPLLATAIRRVVWSNTSFYWRVWTGSRNVNVVPAFGVLFTSMARSCNSRILLVIASPSPE